MADEHDESSHLSRISTRWSVVFSAHRSAGPALNQAREELLLRYCGAVYRFLRRVVGNDTAAEDLAQEFALGVVTGQYQHADPNKGRFRDYLKSSLRHLVAKHQRKAGRLPRSLPDTLDPAQPDSGDDVFSREWQQETLARVWEALAQAEQGKGAVGVAMLRYRVAHTDTTSARMAEEWSAREGISYSAEQVRQIIHRAREKFADLLLEEVARSVETRERAVIERELADLELLEYCRDGLKRWAE